MTDVSIRPAEPRDVPPIIRVAERAWNAVYADVLEQDTIDAAIDDWYTTDAILEYIQNPDFAYFVAERAGTIIGFTSGANNELGKGELATIYLDPDHWREGIGTRLLEHFEAYGRAQGWDELQIRVIGGNDTARGFYEHHGYTVHDRTEGPLLDEEDVAEICYEKSLE